MLFLSLTSDVEMVDFYRFNVFAFAKSPLKKKVYLTSLLPTLYRILFQKARFDTAAFEILFHF
jgi:hypothetical protein